MVRPLSLLPASALLLCAACSGSGGGTGVARAAPGPDGVAAEVAGAPIRLAEVDERAAGRLQRLRDEEYEVRRAALDELITDRLLEAEARRRGLTREALVQAEVRGKVPPPADQEVKELYGRYQSRLGGLTLDEVRPQIVSSLMEQRQAEREAAFRQQLRDKAGVKIHLEQPRRLVPVPADALAQGPADAPVTIVEYLDYQCPYCHRVQPLVDELMARYPGKVRFVQREFLLDKPRSLETARAARCAAEQGRFWEYHRSLLTVPGDMSDSDLGRRASSVGIDAGRFGTCLASGRYDQHIRTASQEGHDLGVSGTPTFFINGRRLGGVRPIEQFTEIIDAELAGRS